MNLDIYQNIFLQCNLYSFVNLSYTCKQLYNLFYKTVIFKKYKITTLIDLERFLKLSTYFKQNIEYINSNDMEIICGVYDVDYLNRANRMNRRGRVGRVDNMVNILVAEKSYSVDEKEMMRVICPGGVLLVQKKGKWEERKKPQNRDMDEWTHYLHDPEGTMTGKDKIAGMPKGIRWMSAPKWLRNHDFMSSLIALVTSEGRIFYIIDEGLRNHIYLPTRWTLVARDAFNGTLLWKRRIDTWFSHIFPFKSGPSYQPRRLVAVEDRVYVTLGFIEPLTVLDGATGKTIRTYKGTEATEEVVVSHKTLYLVVDPDKKPQNYTHELPPNRGKERDRELMRLRAAEVEILGLVEERFGTGK